MRQLSVGLRGVARRRRHLPGLRRRAASLGGPRGGRGLAFRHQQGADAAHRPRRAACGPGLLGLPRRAHARPDPALDDGDGRVSHASRSGNVYARAFLERLFPLDDRCGDATNSACLVAAPYLGDVVTIARPLVCYRVHGANRTGLLQDPCRFRRQIERVYQ